MNLCLECTDAFLCGVKCIARGGSRVLTVRQLPHVGAGPLPFADWLGGGGQFVSFIISV